MKVAFFVHTPAQAHLWRNIGAELARKGQRIMFFVRDHESTREILNRHGIPYTSYGKQSESRYVKLLQLPMQFRSSLSLASSFEADIFLGTGLIEVYVSLFLKKPCIVFDDSEPTPFFERIQWQPIAKVVVTPDCFRKDLGTKQFRLAGYKELAYLSPNWFEPDPSVLDDVGVGKKESYVILRFNAFDAVHDIGRRGFSIEDKYRLVQELEKYARVFISSERELPDDLKKYELPIPFDRIHHALYYAELLVGDTGTMATEAAVLGTPAVVCFSSVNRFGNFAELEQKYGLMYAYTEPARAIQKAVELIQTPGLKEEWRRRREVLLKDKIDVTAFMVWFIENYPESYREIKENPEIQFGFR